MDTRTGNALNWQRKCERMQAINRELLAALQRSSAALDTFSPFALVQDGEDGGFHRIINEVSEQSRAAIAKASEVTP